MIEKIVIIGSGPAGLTAGIYAARAGFSPLLFEGFQSGGIPGGQLMMTGVVENFPGFSVGIEGHALMSQMKEQAIRSGVKIITDDIEDVRLDCYPFTMTSASDETFTSLTIIVATGATALRLPLASEKVFWGKGISACAVCDGALPLFRNKPLAVIGGGDTAIEEAVHLTKFGSKVYLIHRRDSFRASKTMQERIKQYPKIEVLWNKTVEEFFGTTTLQGAILKDTVTGATSTIEISGAFEAIGHKPNVGFLKGQLPTDDKGYLLTKSGKTTATIVEGVFAAGDVQDPKFRQAICAAGNGCMASLEAEHWLREHCDPAELMNDTGSTL
jgi:thioredoxin reductase (NADPH)